MRLLHNEEASRPIMIIDDVVELLLLERTLQGDVTLTKARMKNYPTIIEIGPTDDGRLTIIDNM